MKFLLTLYQFQCLERLFLLSTIQLLDTLETLKSSILYCSERGIFEDIPVSLRKSKYLRFREPAELRKLCEFHGPLSGIWEAT